MTPRILHVPRGEALAIVAHPDDETIWMGGTILSAPQTRWTILSLCRKDDADRASKFRRVCRRMYHARPLMSGLEDEGVMNIRESIPEIERRLRRELAGVRVAALFTHGYNGEYGHPRHKGVHRGVLNLLRRNVFSADSIFCFAYEPNENKVTPVRNAPFVSLLSQNTYKKKRMIIRDIYEFEDRSFEMRSAGKKEAFIQFAPKKI